MSDAAPDTALTRAEIAAALRAIGLAAGQTVLVHSALRTLGRVDGGAETVVDALLDVVGPRGTLVAPTFTFVHEIEADPIIDAGSDPSEMGAISEAVRRRPDARRSTAFRHSFAAIGRRADVIAGVDPRLPPFDLRSAFGVLLALDAQVLLLGVTYANSTSHHFGEWLAEVSYREARTWEAGVRRSDGTIEPMTLGDYQPQARSADGSYYGPRRTDFNHLGLLEQQRLASVGSVGNAMGRRFAIRDLIRVALREAESDENIFRTPEGRREHITALPDGAYVFSDPTVDGAGRDERHLWTVVEPQRIFGWRETWEVRWPTDSAGQTDAATASGESGSDAATSGSDAAT